MHFISIAIKTTGIDPDVNNVIEFAAVADKIHNKTPLDQLPTFHSYIIKHHYTGTAKALKNNNIAFQRIADKDKNFLYSTEDYLVPRFKQFLIKYEFYPSDYFTVASTRFWLDRQFLNKIPEFEHLKIYEQYFNPTILFFAPQMEKLPSRTDCFQVANIPQDLTTDAITDAINTLKLIRYVFK